MKKLIKDLILSKIEAEEETTGSIATYAIVRHASAVMSLKIYWNRKAVSGSKTMLQVELDNNPETGKTTITVMEEILTEARTMSLKEKLEKQFKKTEKTKGGFDV